jgi:hypothetical protein
MKLNRLFSLVLTAVYVLLVHKLLYTAILTATLSGYFLLAKIVSEYFLLPNRKYPDSLFLCRDISCWAILSEYFLLAQCRDISYWVCRDKYVPPNIQVDGRKRLCRKVIKWYCNKVILSVYILIYIQRQETLDLPYLTLLCDNLKNRMFL